MSNTRFVPLRTAALCACLLSSALLTGCGGGSSTPTATTTTNGPVTSATRTYNNLQFTLSADKAVYASRDKPTFTLTVKNVGTQSVTFDYSDGQTYRFNVSQNAQLVSTYPQGAGQVFTSIQFVPGETKVFTGSWNQMFDATGQHAPAGQYTVTAYLPVLGSNGTLISASDAQTNLSANPITIQTQ